MTPAFIIQSITALAAVIAQHLTSLDQRAQDSIAHNLTPAVIFENEPAPRSGLPARQSAYMTPAISVTVVRDGHIRWSTGYGDTTTPETVFQAASLSKAVAAAGIIKLAEMEGFSLDADLNDVLVGVDMAAINPQGRPVTLRGLLSHTAGATVRGFPGYRFDEPVPTNLALIRGQGANTPAIEIQYDQEAPFRYSGGGYQLAQLWAEETTQEDFPVLMDRLILQPMGMTNSSFEIFDEGAIGTRAAAAHTGLGERIEGGWNNYPEGAAAGLWTTADDYARFLIGLMAAEAGDETAGISPDTAHAMTTLIASEYGLGLAIMEPEGERQWSHDGSNRGYRSSAYAWPDRGDAIVVMTNATNGFTLANDIIRTTGPVYGWPTDAPLQVSRFPMSESALIPLAGAYGESGAPNPVFTLEYDGNALTGRYIWGVRFELIPVSEETFINPDNGRRMRFISTEDGTIQVERSGRVYTPWTDPT